MGHFSPPVDCVRLGAGPPREHEMGPSSGAIPSSGYSMWEGAEGCRGWLVALQVSPSPNFYDSGNPEPHCFSLSERRSFSWGSWQTCRWPVGWRRMGSRAWHFFTDSHCLFLVRLSSRSHAPPLRVPRDPAFSCSGEGKGPGRRDRSGSSPSKAALLGPQ